MTELIRNARMPRFNLPFHSGMGRILVTQALVTGVGAVLFSFMGFAAFYSAVLGGVACIIPNAYSVWRVFGIHRRIHRYDPNVFGIMLRAEMVKFALTGAVFAAMFWLIQPIDPVAMFSVFTAALLIGWIEAGLKLQ